MKVPLIVQRAVPAHAVAHLCAAGCQPLLARIYAARGVAEPVELDDAFTRLHPLDSMLNLREMAHLLADAIAAQARLGTHWAAQSELEIEVAERLQAMVPGAERVRFNNSATEVAMSALRLARGLT
ncbi:MAG: hypothetical protein ACXWCX_21500, partial [Burkholderiales bacterium]